MIFLKQQRKKLLLGYQIWPITNLDLIFLFTGELSKITLSESKPADRHKWITNINNINQFISAIDEKEWKIKVYDFIAERKRNIFLFYLEKFLSKFFSGYLFYEKFFIVKKINIK